MTPPTYAGLLPAPRHIACLAALGASLAWPAWAAPQAALPPTPASPHAISASLRHSALKGVTLKAITVSTSFVIFALGTGSLASGGAMAAALGAASYLIYVANDYAWDHLVPNTNVSSNHESFRPGYSLTRNTAKYLTFKPLVVAANFGIVYSFAPTLATAAVTSAAAVFILPVTYYANNMLWDWYDWHDASAATVTQHGATDTAH